MGEKIKEQEELEEEIESSEEDKYFKDLEKRVLEEFGDDSVYFIDMEMASLKQVVDGYMDELISLYKKALLCITYSLRQAPSGAINGHLDLLEERLKETKKSLLKVIGENVRDDFPRRK